MANPPDPALVAAFERACQDAQVPSTRVSAEASIKHLTQRPDAIPIALAVAQHTASSVARFHAAVTLRTAATQSWTSLTPPQRYGPSSLRYWLVNYVVATPTLLAYERKALLRTAAILTRRAYLEEPPGDRDHFFALVCETAASPDPGAGYAAMAASELVELLAEEFMAPKMPGNASFMQRELLVQARARFAAPHGDLVRLLRATMTALSVVLTVAGHPPMGSPEFDARVLPVLGTILRVLATDLTQLQLNPTADAPLDLYAEATSGSESLEAVVISAFSGREWLEVIDLVPTILRLCLMVTGMHCNVQNPDIEPKPVPKATQIVTAVSAISQRSYRTVEDADRLLASLLDEINEQKWSSSQLGIVRLAYAEVWRRISCAHGLVTVERIGSGYLETFTKDTCQELDSAAVSLASPDADEEDVFSSDVADMLLETWANIALQGDDGSKTAEHPLAGPIGEVVYHFTKIWLKSSLENEPGAELSVVHDADAEEDLGFEDRSVADARLAAAAVLLRFVLNKMAPAIAQSLLQVAEKVFQWSDTQAGRTTIPLDVFQEDLYFLIRLTAGVLADEAKGEHPSVPIQFLSAVPVNGHGKPPLNAQILLSALFEVAQGESHLLERRGIHCDEASPRVGATILDALTRVTRTYLVPLNVDGVDFTRSAFEVIGGVALARTGRSGCMKKALEGISRRGFESDVAEAAANLLCALAAGAPNYSDIRESQIWHSLLQAGARAYQTLPATAVRLVGKCLTKVLGDIVADRLLIPAYNSLQSLIETREQDPDAAERAIAIVNLLRGAANCENIGPRTREALLVSLRAPDGVAASCAKAFGRTRPDVARSLINLADDIVSSCLVHLSEQDSRDLLANAVTIVKLHTEIVGSFLTDTVADELGSDVEEILALLSRILDEETEFDVSEACYVGLSTLFPILTEDILAVPTVHAGFFGFTTRLVSQHPEWLVRLPPDLCGKIIHTLELQRMSVDMGSEMRSLEAIASLARSRALKTEDGQASSVVDTALLRFLKLIFMGVASGGAHTENMDAAADALLCLIHVKLGGRSALEDVGRDLLCQGGNSATLRTAIQELGRSAAQAGSAHGLNGAGNVHPSATIDRPAQLQASKSFREAVATFSATTKKCLLSIAVGSAIT